MIAGKVLITEKSSVENPFYSGLELTTFKSEVYYKVLVNPNLSRSYHIHRPSHILYILSGIA